MKKTLVAMILTAASLVGCTSTKDPKTGLTTTQVDKDAISAVTAAIHQLLNEQAVSNALYNASAPKK
jgi:hypothetical protein